MTVPGANVTLEKTATRVGVAKGSSCVHHLLTSDAVSTASRVLPMAIAKEVAIDPNVIASARNAPPAMAGQTRFPHSRQDASANPLGGQIGLALGCREATASPNLANRRYASPSAAKQSAPPMPRICFDVSTTKTLSINLVGRPSLTGAIDSTSRRSVAARGGHQHANILCIFGTSPNEGRIGSGVHEDGVQIRYRAISGDPALAQLTAMTRCAPGD